MKKDWGEKRWRRVAKFRLEGGLREGKYWKEEKEKIYRLCGREEETWEHLWEIYRDWKEKR